MQRIPQNVSVALPDWTPAYKAFMARPLGTTEVCQFRTQFLGRSKAKQSHGLTPYHDHDSLTAAMQLGFCAVGTMSHQNVGLNINSTCRLNSLDIEPNDSLALVLPLSVQHCFFFILHSFMQCFSRNCCFEKLEYERVLKSVKAALVLQSLVWRSIGWNLCPCLPWSTFNVSVKHLRLKRT